MSEQVAEPEIVAFLLVPNFTMIAFSSALEPLRIANRMSGRELYKWVILSKDGLPVTSSSGVDVAAHLPMGRFELSSSRPPSIVVCGGLYSERYQDKEVLAWLRWVERRGALVGSICAGAHILGKAGLLEGFRCTIHWENIPGFVEAFPEVNVTADLFEVDRNRFTCAGGTAALDLMLHKIGQSHGDELAARVSEQCILDRVRSHDDRQRMPIRVRLGVHHPKLIMAIELMESNVEEPLAQDQLATYVGMSRRQLERLFKKHLGRTPAQYYLELRLERARHLLYQTDLPIMNVACACGFVSASHFSTCYRQMYGKTPRQERLAAA